VVLASDALFMRAGVVLRVAGFAPYWAAMAIAAYVHFPWCLQKCPYCDFASGAIKREEVPHAPYANAVLAELSARAASLPREPLASVFFGGGTPSLWRAEQLGRVLEAVRAAFPAVTPDLEVTVECNPTSLDRERARALREVGVNRLSIGAQALDDAQLRFLGRLHDARGALAAIADALSEVERVSADLIFGLPGQRPHAAAEQARTLARTGVQHLSAYTLTIEPNTQFGELKRKGKLPLAPDDDVAEAFERVEDALGGEGFEHYEVSSYARPGQRARHNLHYWHGGAYLGLGAGAVGCLPTDLGKARRYRNEPKPERYFEQSARRAVEVFEESLAPQDLIRERLMLGLRTSDGADLAALARDVGADPRVGREAALARALERGDVVLEGPRLRVDRARWLHLDSITAALF
jgi:oxygen-independent coproporphyrinogen-3 oxidase